MRFKCSKEDLINGIHIVEKAVAVRSTLPIVSNILVETVPNGVKLIANDLEIGIEYTLKASVAKEGSVLAPAKTFSGIINKLSTGEVQFEVEENGNIRITCGQSKFSIHGLPTDDFPVLPKVKGAQEFEIEAELLKEMIRQTIIAVSMDESKHVLNGVLIEVNKKEICFVATDGYRLAQRRGELNKDTGAKESFIVPTKVLSEINRAIQQKEFKGKIKVYFSKEQIAFTFDNVYFVSRLIQGQFPDYKQVIPKKTEAKIIIPRENLLRAAERSSIIASTSANIIRLETVNKKLHISANTPDVGNASELIDVEIAGQEKNKVALNVRLLLDALKSMDEEDVYLELTGALSPGILKPKNKEQYLYVIMPIRTAESA
ncbi:DNA polymerase III subunit beta [Candidatus Margulisiibacteriota bacterium]